MRNVLQGNVGQAPARQAAIFAGLPSTVEAITINKVCASGLKAVVLAAQNIQLGLAEAQVAGGMENMTRVPYYIPRSSGLPAFGNVQMEEESQNTYEIPIRPQKYMTFAKIDYSKFKT